MADTDSTKSIYWARTKHIAWAWITGWKIIPLHAGNVAAEVWRAIMALLSALAAVLAIALCFVAPLLFWLSPLIALWLQWLERRLEKKLEAERQKIIPGTLRHSTKAKESAQ